MKKEKYGRLTTLSIKIACSIVLLLGVKMIKKYLIMILYILIAMNMINTSENRKKDFEIEVKKFFPDKNNYITSVEIKNLLSIKESNVFIEELFNIVRNKSFPLELYSDFDTHNNEYTFNKIIIRLAGVRESNIDIYFEIFTEINKNPNFEYISSYLLGGYSQFYKIILQNFDKVDKSILKTFISSLPNEKKCILSKYIILKESGIKINYNSFFNIYNKISRKNYSQLIKNAKELVLDDIDFRDLYIEELEYYYKILDLKDSL